MALRVFMFSEYQLQHPELEEILWPVLCAAREGVMSSEFWPLLTKENLSYKLNFGPDAPLDPKVGGWDTIIGTFAQARHLEQIPGDVLAALATEVLDAHGTTVLHAAALSGCLNQLPESALNPENLFRRFDSRGRSPALLVIERGCFSHIPSKLRRTEYLAHPFSRGWTIFHSAAEGEFLDKIPKHLLTVKTMSLQTHDGTTPLHLAARHDRLWQVPRTAFTLQTLKLRDSQGSTPLHLAVDLSGSRIPNGLLCEEILLQVDGQGDTVLHTLWRDGEPCVVDPEFYTPEMLALKGCGGMTVLDYAARIGMLHFIPKKCQEAGCALRYEQEREEAAAEMEYREEGEATAAEIED